MPPALDSAMIVADVLTRWPEAASVFVRRGMACVGCAMAPFMSLREAALAYGLSVEDLLAALVSAIDTAPADA